MAVTNRRELFGREALLELGAKYRTLAKLRRDRAGGAAAPARVVFQRLSGRFPGALNELDTLPLEELDRRAVALERAATDPGAVEPWMEWLWTFHALMRAALFAKRRRSFAKSTDDLAKAASEHAEIDVSAELMRRLAAPPNGRIVGMVFDEVGARFEQDGATVWTALFPRRRAERLREGRDRDKGRAPS